MGHHRLVGPLPRLEPMSGTRPLKHVAAALRTLCGVAALVGLFAMHGLAAHGTAHQAHPIEAAALVSTDHHAAAPAMDHESTPPASSSSGDREQGPGLLGLTALCLAVLLLGVVLAVVLGRGVAVEGNRSRAFRAGGRPTRARRDRDPPCLFALSIQRC